MPRNGISVVVGSYNRRPFLKLTIESIRKELKKTSFPSEIIVVDGGSTDGTLKWLIKQKDIITIIQHNHGFWRGKPVERRSWGYFMNLAFKCARGKYVCMLSDDCLVIPGAISNGYSYFEKKIKDGENPGAAAFYWRDWPDQENYKVGLTLNDKMFVNHGLYLKKALEEVNYIDEDNYKFYHADGDLVLKMWETGYSCVDSPDSYIEHFSHANKKVRQKNINHAHSDWNNYLTKWKVDNNKTGRWVEKYYKDPDRTYRQFFKPFTLKPLVLRHLISINLLKIKQSVKKRFLNR
jgi:glycosyltransferase involved in cell wall biosynthesis